jgi:hypothetical protein
MSSETDLNEAPNDAVVETPAESRERVLKTASTALMTSLSITVLWLYFYNLVVHKMNPVLAFFKILDGVNDLVLGMGAVVVIGLGIVVIFTLTTLFTQTITNLYSVRLLEDLLRDHLFKGEYKLFFTKMLTFNDLPVPESPFPRHVSSAILVLSYHYVIAWFYVVVFSECLYFAAWSAGVYLDLYPESMNTIPLFAVAVPFTARLMAYFKYPYADDYAAFIPGILFVVVLLLAFVAAMSGPFQFFVVDVANRSEVGFFEQGALLWKFLQDGLMIAFYPVFGEVVFFYLQYQKLKAAEEREEADAHEAAAAEVAS